MSVRTAVVLAAGEGTRLRPLTRNRPNPMLPAANRPILEHVFDALVDADVAEIVVVVGYQRERVQEYFGPEYRGVPLTYVVQEKQLGSGHALLQAREAAAGPRQRSVKRLPRPIWDLCDGSVQRKTGQGPTRTLFGTEPGPKDATPVWGGSHQAASAHRLTARKSRRSRRAGIA